MAKRMVVEKLFNLTLVRKGRATAKHPLLREGVVEVVKATPAQPVLSQDPVERHPMPQYSTKPDLSAPTPAPKPVEPLDEFLEALRRALHGNDSRIVEKATTQSPNLRRWQSGRWG